MRNGDQFCFKVGTLWVVQIWVIEHYFGVSVFFSVFKKSTKKMKFKDSNTG